MKYRVRKGCNLIYPDGTLRGERGYVVDGDDPVERATLAEQGGALEILRDRQTPPSPRDDRRMAGSVPAVDATEDEAETPVKKKAKRKRKSILKRIKGED